MVVGFRKRFRFFNKYGNEAAVHGTAVFVLVVGVSASIYRRQGSYTRAIPLDAAQRSYEIMFLC